MISPLKRLPFSLKFRSGGCRKFVPERACARSHRVSLLRKRFRAAQVNLIRRRWSSSRQVPSGQVAAPLGHPSCLWVIAAEQYFLIGRAGQRRRRGENSPASFRVESVARQPSPPGVTAKNNPYADIIMSLICLPTLKCFSVFSPLARQSFSS